jgi:hypothetical protein
MELRTTREATNRAATQEFPSILWNTNFITQFLILIPFRMYSKTAILLLSFLSVSSDYEQPWSKLAVN